jgi:sugar lactone lactonase YvrE
VLTLEPSGTSQIVAEFDEMTSGLGFLPDGTPIVVLRQTKRIVRLGDGKPVVHADLSGIPSSSLNDMVVGRTGRAYVDSIIRPGSGDPGEPCLVRVEPDGSAFIATRDIESPNGLAITADGARLVCASTRLRSIEVFTIDDDGGLSDRRRLCSTGDADPDGICLDSDNAVWVAGLETGRFDRFLADGTVAQSISVGDRLAIACVLGGPDRRTLFMATADATRDQARSHDRGARGFIEAARVDVPGAGWP